jgi:hypothetical protein
VSVCGTVPSLLILEDFLGRLFKRIPPAVAGSFSAARILPCGRSPDFPGEQFLTQKRESDNALFLVSFVTPSKNEGAPEY